MMAYLDLQTADDWSAWFPQQWYVAARYMTGFHSVQKYTAKHLKISQARSSQPALDGLTWSHCNVVNFLAM